MKRTTIFLAIVAFFLLAGSVLAMESTNYRLDWFTPGTGGGGGPASSTNYAADFTIGQTASGLSSSANYQVGLGYWYGLGWYRIYLPLIMKQVSHLDNRVLGCFCTWTKSETTFPEAPENCPQSFQEDSSRGI